MLIVLSFDTPSCRGVIMAPNSKLPAHGQFGNDSNLVEVEVSNNDNDDNENATYAAAARLAPVDGLLALMTRTTHVREERGIGFKGLDKVLASHSRLCSTWVGDSEQCGNRHTSRADQGDSLYI
jgi:hypothetical protein